MEATGRRGITGLTPGVLYYFRYHIHDVKTGARTWCDPLSLVIT